MLKTAGRFFAAGIVSIVSAAALEAEGYRLGEGVQLGETPVYLGGYFSLDYWHNLKGTSELQLEGASIMLYGGKEAWSFMVETEFSDVYRRRFGFNSETTSDLTPHAERVYVRYEPSEHFQATVGKFNTPVGYWNLMPINVLRDTTSSPRIVSLIFPRFTTGVDLSVSEGVFSFNVLGQATPDLDTAFNDDEPYNNFDIEKQVGLGVRTNLSLWSFGVNAGGYEERIEEEKWGYLYASAEYRTEKTHVMAETGYRRNEKNIRSNFGAYIQGTRLIVPRHYAVARLEYTTEFVERSEDSIAVFGYTYRPLYPIAFKGEYQFHSRENEDQLIVSFSMLF